MENKELLQYLKDAIELETDIAIQQKICEEANRVSANNQPELRLLKMPEKPSMSVVDGPSDSSAVWIFGAVACFVIGVLLLTVTVEGFLFFSAAGILLLACRFYGKWKYNQEVTFVNQKYAHAQRCYEETLSETKRRNSVLQNDYHKAVNLWNQSNEQIAAFLMPPLAKTKEILALHYAKDMIYPKYRTLPALTSIYEYMLTGRCTELTGPHGAYNMYEDELRKDTVISQLNAVIENLEQIKQNQYMLYQQVKAIQDNTSVIASELRQIKGYTVQIAQLTALNAYYAALNERNTRITMYYHL